jgi:hypothetical protein
VPVCQDVGFDDDRIATDALDREPASIDFGSDPFNDNPLPSCFW